MGGGGVFDGSNMTVTLQNHRPPCSSDVLESLWISNSSPSFHGDSGSSSTSMANLEDVRVGNPSDTPFFASFEKEKNCNANEDYDGCFYQPEKKRRLTVDQVRFLERNFEVENKLEPERKVQLAEELGLQPRQVAIWFQNRRARCRTKQLEKDYDCLKASYDKLKADYDSLLKENERFRNEVRLLKDKLLPREKEDPNSEPIDFINQMVAEPQKQIPNAASENKSNEDASMAKSDSESHSSLLEPADSCHAFGSEQSDFSQGDEDELTRTLFPPLCFPKLEDECYNDQPENWNFPVEGQPAWLWPY